MKTFATWNDANAFAVSKALRGVFCTVPVLIDGAWQVRHAETVCNRNRQTKRGYKMRKAYLQFGSAATLTPGPFQTVGARLRETDTPRSGRSLTGYGGRIPGTAYIGKPGAWIATVSIER